MLAKWGGGKEYACMYVGIIEIEDLKTLFCFGEHIMEDHSGFRPLLKT